MKTIAVLLAGLISALLTPATRAEIRIQGAGATFPAPLYQRWVSEYEKLHPDVKIDYEANGSGGGIKGVTSNTVDFGASDAPLSKAELAKAAAADGGQIVEIPATAGAVVVAYNLPGFSGELKLDGPTVADIFLGRIANWNDPRIITLNEGAKLPDTPIVTAHRTDASGTTFIFTSYLAGQSDAFREGIGAGKQVEWKGGQGGKGNPGVAEIVGRTPGAIGYIELIYAQEKNTPHALLKNKDGAFVKASAESVSAAGEGALAQMADAPTGLAVNIWDQPGKNSYPISSFTYILVHQDLRYLKSADKAKSLAGFLRWAITDGQQFADELHYAPLSKSVQDKSIKLLDTLAFEGQPLK